MLGVSARWVLKAFLLEDEKGQQGHQGLLKVFWLEDTSRALKGAAGWPALPSVAPHSGISLTFKGPSDESHKPPATGRADQDASHYI